MNTSDNFLSMLDTLCPMHVVLNSTGHIVHAGPTTQKLHPNGPSLIGQRFLEIFVLKRPRAVASVTDLLNVSGMKLHLQMRDPPMTELKGVLVPSLYEGQIVVNLSFGISIVDAVGEFGLNCGDFAHTDLTIEMLYLVEAKSAAMEASRKMNLRLQGAKIAAEEQAFTDTLTGLKNRRAMDHFLERYIEEDRTFALMQIDLDFFKAVNDTKGHAAGDHVLQVVSRVMVDETRETDTVARIGGDEFIILLPSAQSEASLRSIGGRIISKLEVPILFQGEHCQISASIGTAFFEPGCELTADQLVSNADVALYASKDAGRARQTFFNPKLRQSVTQLVPQNRQEDFAPDVRDAS